MDGTIIKLDIGEKMKSIATITFHASHNYGSVLQAYALAKVMENEGYNVKIINYRSKQQKNCYTLYKRYRGAKGALRNLYQRLISGKLKRRYKGFEQFINNVLPVTEEVNDEREMKKYASAFDFYVCGSDQIWNPACQDFSSVYYLDFVDGKKRIAYAPSLGKGEFDDEHKALIKNLLENIDDISVRERQGKALIEGLTDKSVELVCDPVILLGKQGWEKVIPERKIKTPYMFVYFLENNHGDRSYIRLIAKTLGLKVVILNENIKDIFKNYIKKYDALPLEFVSLIKNASFVYTNSFHATAFSTMFNVPCASMIAKSDNVQNNNDSRKIDFLTALGLDGCLKKSLTAEEIVALSKTDFEKANEELDKLREKSKNYLVKAIES